MDEETGRFLRLQADRLAAIYEQLQPDGPPDRANAVSLPGRLIAVAADLLAKAQELDGKGIVPTASASMPHRRH
jgi:hypothetical protein